MTPTWYSWPGLVLPAGVLSDRFGRKRRLVFGVSSFFASQMSSADGLIALRAVMGVGAAPILVLIYSILPSMCTGPCAPARSGCGRSP